MNINSTAAQNGNQSKGAISHPSTADFLRSLEDQMKELWRQYVERLDQRGLDETAESLRRQYYNLYNCYKMNREWIQVVHRQD